MNAPKIVSDTRLFSFVNELKERKVLRVAVAYIVVTWIAIQVGESTFEALNLPVWANTLLVVFSMLGFPFALLLAWAYEITPDGLVDELGSDWRSQPASETLHYDGSKLDTENPSQSIAVLQFEDMSFEQDQTYFCEGLAEEILGDLNDIDGLHVAARLASFQFGARSADVLEIGRKLHVSVVLEGSVRKSGNQVRITVQLINTMNGYQFWAGQYNHNMNDIFEVQAQISQAVVNVMRLSIKGDLITKPITESIDAYNLYLKASRYYSRPDIQSIIFARQLFTRAVEIDSGFGHAWAKLSSTYAYEYLCTKPNEEYRTEAKRISDIALRLAPSIPETHIARGMAYSICQDFAEADLEFEIAIGLEPDSHSAWFNWARSKTYQGELHKAIEYYQKTSEVEENCYRCVLTQMSLLASVGDTAGALEKAEEGLRKAEAFLELNLDDNRARNMGAFALYRLGRVNEAHEWMNTSLMNSPRNSALTYNAAGYYALAGDVDKSLDYLAQSVDSGCLDLTWLEQDSDFDSVRNNSRFRAIIERFKA